MQHEEGTARELNLQPGDSVEHCGHHFTIARVDGGQHFTECGYVLDTVTVWRITSRAARSGKDTNGA